MILNFIFKISLETAIVKKIFKALAEEPKLHEYPLPGFFLGKNKKQHRNEKPRK